MVPVDQNGHWNILGGPRRIPKPSIIFYEVPWSARLGWTKLWDGGWEGGGGGGAAWVASQVAPTVEGEPPLPLTADL